MAKRQAAPETPLWQFGPYRATATGLVVSGSTTFEQWSVAFYNLCQFRNVSAWTLGDMINEGREKWERDDRYETALEATHLKYGTLANYASCCRTFPPELRREHPELLEYPFAWIRELAHLDLDDAFETLALAKDQAWGWEEFHAHIKGGRRARQETARSFPDGKFGLILADPPWTYDGNTAPPDREIGNHYRQMTLAEIQELKDPDGRSVQEISADDCVLYLWVPSPKVVEGVSVIHAWGYELKTTMVWVKDIMGMGYWARQRHELLFVATKGKPLTPRESDRPDSVIQAPRREHSQKPDEAYDMIERCYPGVPKVELFARAPRPTWAGWGLEFNDAAPRAIRLSETPDEAAVF
jgi:N6-adenosine-specific RNA methylase IME4